MDKFNGIHLLVRGSAKESLRTGEGRGGTATRPIEGVIEWLTPEEREVLSIVGGTLPETPGSPVTISFEKFPKNFGSKELRIVSDTYDNAATLAAIREVIGERIAFRRAKVAEIREKPEAQFDSEGRLSEYGAVGDLRKAGFGADPIFTEIAPVGERVKRETILRREEEQREYFRNRRAEYLARPLTDLVTVYGENRVSVYVAPGYSSENRYTSEVLPEDPEVRDRYAASCALGDEMRAEIRARKEAALAAEEAEKAADREAFVAYAKGSAQLAPAAEDGYDIVPAVAEEISRLAHAEILAALENAGYGPDCGRHVAESPSPDRDAPLYPGPLAAAVAVERDLRGRLARIPLPARGLKVELSRILSGRFGGEKAPILFVTFSGELIETLAYGIDLRQGD